MQIDMLGTRPADELAYIRSDQALQFLAGLPHRDTVPWATMFPEASEKAIDLLDKMLQFHPSKRISVLDSLHHPYFDSVRTQYPETDPVLPVGAGGLDFAFEGDESLTLNHFKRLIVEEVASFRAEKALARRIRTEKMAAAGGAGAVSGGSADDDGMPTGHAMNGGVEDETMLPASVAAGQRPPSTVAGDPFRASSSTAASSSLPGQRPPPGGGTVGKQPAQYGIAAGGRGVAR